jgi:outer membrane murein-binding lipoprotein Lpp
MKQVTMAGTLIAAIVLSALLAGCSHTGTATSNSTLSSAPKDPNAPTSAADIQKEITNIQKYAPIPEAQKEAAIQHLQSQLPPGSTTTQ